MGLKKVQENEVKNGEIIAFDEVLEVRKKDRTFLSKVYVNCIKNILDWILALIGIIISLPVMLIIGIAIKIEDGGPIFFVQKRSGKNGIPFNMYKFRSMITSNDVHDFSKENKYTRVGKFLRKTSLDELPQLFCILKSDMSFIGPRPWIEDYNKYFNKNQRRRLEVKPGLSGLAQAKNRNNISIQEKIKWDIYYVDHLSLIMDIKVLFRTIQVVFSKSGAEMPKSGIKEELEILKNQNASVEKEIIGEAK